MTKLGKQTVSDGRELSRAVVAILPGSRTTLTVVRQGKTEEIPVTIGQRPGEQTASL